MTVKIDSAQINSVRKVGLTVYEKFVTHDTEKCLLSALNGVHFNVASYLRPRQKSKVFLIDQVEVMHFI